MAAVALAALLSGAVFLYGSEVSISPASAQAPDAPPVVRSKVGASALGLPPSDSQRGIPSNVVTPNEKFQFLMECGSFRKFRTIFELNRTNPDYPMNSASALAGMKPISRQMLEERIALVERAPEECVDWANQTSVNLANWQIYEATLEAAIAGDPLAAVCFVSSSWAPVEHFTEDLDWTPEMNTLRDTYTQFSGEFIDREIRRGNWSMVVKAVESAGAQHGVQSAGLKTQSQKYIWLRLMQLGVPDPQLEEAYGYQSAEVGSMLTAQELSKANAEVEKLYRTSFRGAGMTEKEFYENCGN